MVSLCFPYGMTGTEYMVPVTESPGTKIGCLFKRQPIWYRFEFVNTEMNMLDLTEEMVSLTEKAMGSSVRGALSWIFVADN